ncbi:His-Xaa-Ser system protein HxsD [Lacrimispora sp. 210928-DFI.3.58]|uniref:His-Xaa-Ser system protein HxsD n=1 Tax=Lacrimispora sp. 210928-DFI.3.58 TaxID=2883214 RepID=UPI001D08BE5F|nr:His-Xaa-Ser system protein HxsD [Lacrimispora sp. 210928-DFI.3.58]MCB7320470.1 His-Xaa-Ser system protein HxsD [Lacrimispora sp. 210928-DFI.3.58]
MKKINIKLDAGIYPKVALLKAAFAFIDKYYIHLAIEDNDYCVMVTAKENGDLSDTIQCEFENELLSQTIRYEVFKQTHVLREVLMARAMASTMIMDEDPIEAVTNSQDGDENLDMILEDWFEHDN